MEVQRRPSKNGLTPATTASSPSQTGPTVAQVVAAVPTSKQRWTRSSRLWCKAAKLVLNVMRPACSSGPLTWLLTFTFTLGNIFTGKPPADQSDADLLCMTTMVATSCHCITVLAPYALSLQKFSHLDGTPWTLFQLVTRLTKKVWCFYFAVHVLAIGATYAIVSAAHDFSAVFKTHLYLSCMWNSLYRAAVDEASRFVYQRETMEGDRRGYVNNAPHWKRYCQAVGRATNFTVIAIVAASLVHICSVLDLLQSNFATLKFSIGSVALKSIVLTITKWLALKRGGTHLRKIYVLTAVPTVLINTQVRLVLLRNGKSGSSLRSFLELGMLEPSMRMTKVWHLRRTMGHQKRVQGNRRGETKPVAAVQAGVRRVSTILPLSKSSEHRLVRSATIFDARQSLLHFHAAESHAEMCSEYIAIICSTSIFFFLQHHPRFGWHNEKESDLVEWEETLLAGVWQVGIEVVVDFICCVFELANGIPLHAAERLGGFLTAVFTSSALVSVSISTILCAHEAGSTQL
ncbi:hypothetical protein PHYPSEUDO_011428 [Phytophthora pseudosyringae]|uniref:Transmembrane protein n=1 Tax=Phytophthora pseudosyringae TaxID=221518 RepID=A0A8T1V9E8_9STRA|nr:hypothetical protein PHYPSEUDO_011428 [Phytophthora pseudosyringae]